MNNEPYGAWVGKNELIPVSYESHWEDGFDYLKSTMNIRPDKTCGRKYSIYAIMFRLGYVRLVFGYESYKVEYWEHIKPTKYQKDYIRNASDVSYASWNKLQEL